MKHYHGTPIGGKSIGADEFAENRLLLIPWKRPDDLSRAKKASRGFMVDNSAFSFWRKKQTINWAEYIAWCRGFARNPRFDFAIIPDVIDGTEDDNDKLIAMWDKKCWHPIKIMGCPVWHMHESIDRLVTLCRRWDRVAIGSSGDYPTPGTDNWHHRMGEAFASIRDANGYPIAKIHGLRMLSTDIVSRYPFASCDSTNAVQNASREAKKNNVDSAWGAMTIARRIEKTISPSKIVDCNMQKYLLDIFTRKDDEAKTPCGALEVVE